MDKEYVGYILAILGIALIAIGALNVAGYVNFQVIDTTPPTIFYTYPANGMTYKPSDLNEIIVYAKDSSDVVSASYNDKYGLKTLTVTPYTQLKHPLTIQGRKFPDVNFDGKVDNTDLNLVANAYQSNTYNSDYDVVPDGVIDSYDLTFVGSYVTTATFAVSITSPYSTGENVSFTFSVLDSAGNVATTQGSFSTGEYTTLPGTWKINDKLVETSMMVELTEAKATITFICNDTSISAQDVTVKATVGGSIIFLQYTGSYTWQKTIDLPSGISTVILEASTQTSKNMIMITVKTPEAFMFTIGHALMVGGGILLVAGIIVIFKKEEVW